MKNKYLPYSILRLVIAVLAISLLFVPLCSLKLPMKTQSKAAQVMAIALIANDRGDISDRDLEKLAKKCEVTDDEYEEIRNIYVGKSPEGKLPFSIVDTAGFEEDDREGIFRPIVNETGDVDDRIDYSTSVFSLVSNTIKNMPIAISLIGYNVLPEIDDDYEWSESDTERLEETEFDIELISKLRALGIRDSHVFLHLSELDTDNIDDEAIEYMLFVASCPDTLMGIIATVFMLFSPIVLFFIGLSELITLLRFKKKFFELAPAANDAMFSYLPPLSSILLIPFMIRGTTLTTFYYAMLAATLACVLLAIFLPGSAKHNKVGRSYLLGIRIISALSLAVCVFALSTATSFDIFGETVTKSAYKDALKTAEDRYEDDLEDAEEYLEKSLAEFNSSTIEEAAGIVEAVKADIARDSIMPLIRSMIALKALIVFYMILIFNYLIAVIKRFALITHRGFPMYYAAPRYVRYIFVIILSVVLELLFGGFITPFALIFALIMALEIAIAVLRSIFRSKERRYLTEKGERMFNEGRLSETVWKYVSEALEKSKLTRSYLVTSGIYGEVNDLYERIENEDVSEALLIAASNAIVVHINNLTK